MEAAGASAPPPPPPPPLVWPTKRRSLFSRFSPSQSPICVPAAHVDASSSMHTSSSSPPLSSHSVSVDHRVQSSPPASSLRAGECTHYRSSCQLVAPCCGNVAFHCRQCHDEYNDHKLDRRSVEYIICTQCEKVQRGTTTKAGFVDLHPPFVLRETKRQSAGYVCVYIYIYARLPIYLTASTPTWYVAWHTYMCVYHYVCIVSLFLPLSIRSLRRLRHRLWCVRLPRVSHL